MLKRLLALRFTRYDEEVVAMHSQRAFALDLLAQDFQLRQILFQREIILPGFIGEAAHAHDK